MKKNENLSYIILIILVILIRTFIITPIKVNGRSMNNTLENGFIMILNKFDKNYKRYDIVVLKRNNEKLIKRVIALPNEDIEYKNNKLYINNKLVNKKYGIGSTTNFKDYCADNEYFVMGDNRENSFDSRAFGCVNKKDIIGKTNLVLFPLNKIGIVK